MMEMMETQNQIFNPSSESKSFYEASEFMKNFMQAVHDGNREEISTYYSDDMEDLNFPLNADWTSPTLCIHHQIAVFECTLLMESHSKLQMKLILDHSEGYWQILYGETQMCRQKH